MVLTRHRVNSSKCAEELANFVLVLSLSDPVIFRLQNEYKPIATKKKIDALIVGTIYKAWLKLFFDFRIRYQPGLHDGQYFLDVEPRHVV
jgi:hypothetical protein